MHKPNNNNTVKPFVYGLFYTKEAIINVDYLNHILY